MRLLCSQCNTKLYILRLFRSSRDSRDTYTSYTFILSHSGKSSSVITHLRCTIILLLYCRRIVPSCVCECCRDPVNWQLDFALFCQDIVKTLVFGRGTYLSLSIFRPVGNLLKCSLTNVLQNFIPCRDLLSPNYGVSSLISLIMFNLPS